MSCRTIRWEREQFHLPPRALCGRRKSGDGLRLWPVHPDRAVRLGRPLCRAARSAGSETNSIFRHARYVVAENPVTGFAFGLFILIALCALVGPYVVPHDPLGATPIPSSATRAMWSPKIR